MASWDGHSLEEYLGNKIAGGSAEIGGTGSGPLPPTADPDDEVQREAADYLRTAGAPGVEAELDLEPVRAADGDPDLSDQMDEVMDLVSDSGGEPAVDRALPLPPVPDTEGSLVESVEQVSADPDTIVASDEAEPSVDYLEGTPAPGSASAPEALAPPPAPEFDDAPDWLDPGSKARSRPSGDITGEEQVLPASLEAIPASARLSSLSLSPADGDDEDDDLELDLDAEEEPSTPARVRRGAGGGDRLPAPSTAGEGGADPTDETGSS